MSYANQAHTPKPAALLGALAIPLGAGLLLATSLAITTGFIEPENKLEGFTLTPTPIDPPPPAPEKAKPETVVDKPVTQTRAPDVVAPVAPITLTQGPAIETVKFEVPTLVIPNPGAGTGTGPSTLPEPSSTASSIAVVPRGNPGNWIRESDYRTRWINEGLTGIARFSLSVSASGRVTDCTITQSTGHAVLDGATCRLLERRASFKPARNGAGDKVAGIYSSSISWEIPD